MSAIADSQPDIAGSPPRLSRWEWAADSVIAIVLGAAILEATIRQGGQGDFFVKATPGPAPPEPPRLPIPQKFAHSVITHGAGLPGWATPVALLVAAPLVVRRRYPLVAFWAVITASLILHIRVQTVDAIFFSFVCCLVAAYTAVMYSPHRRLTLISVLAGAGLIAGLHDTNVPNITPGFIPIVILLGLAAAASAVHSWKQRVRDLESEHQAAMGVAVERERARIARELHDVVTHNVSVMVVQAGAARKVLDAAPEQSRGALLAIEASGRDALTELRNVMGLLTPNADLTSSGAPDLAPHPGLSEAALLADRVRETGVTVGFEVRGTPPPLSSGADLAAYRVVQEALTNAVKHAAGAEVGITIDYQPDAVRVEVIDSGGTPTGAAASGSGRGLSGLRERLAIYGGTLNAGRRPTGGYRVSAVIPAMPS